MIISTNSFYQFLKDKLSRDIRAELENRYRLVPKTEGEIIEKVTKARSVPQKHRANFKALESIYGLLVERVRGGSISSRIIMNTIDSPAWKHLLKESRLSISEAVSYMTKRLEAQGIDVN